LKVALHFGSKQHGMKWLWETEKTRPVEKKIMLKRNNKKDEKIPEEISEEEEELRIDVKEGEVFHANQTLAVEFLPISENMIVETNEKENIDDLKANKVEKEFKIDYQSNIGKDICILPTEVNFP
jgi:hypothetical protein